MIVLCTRFPSAAREPPVCVPLTYERLNGTRTNPFTFLQQVRAGSRQDRLAEPARDRDLDRMVVVMAVLASIFFLVADQVMSCGVAFVLGIGR